MLVENCMLLTFLTFFQGCFDFRLEMGVLLRPLSLPSKIQRLSTYLLNLIITKMFPTKLQSLVCHSLFPLRVENTERSLAGCTSQQMGLAALPH